MKILFALVPAFNPNDGGVQRTTFKLGKFFTENGLQVSYFSLQKTGHVSAEYGTLYYVQEEGEGGNKKNTARLRNILTEVRPDIVINQMPYEIPLREALFASKQQLGFILLGCLRNSLFSVKNNLTDTVNRMLPASISKGFNNAFGQSVALNIHKYKHARQLKAIINQHDLYILLAPPNRDELQYFIGAYKPEKVIAIPNSIPYVEQQTHSKEKIILHVGRLNIPQKRSDLLLPFWDKVYPELPDWEFWIVGNGPEKNNLEKQIARENIPRVRLLGYQKPEVYYRKASIFMMPSAFEGFPNTILEAQSYGCPIVAFKSYAALDWIVHNRKDAVLIKPYNTSEMAKETVVIAKEQSLLKEMSEHAKINARRFTIDKVGMIWLELFNKLLKK